MLWGLRWSIKRQDGKGKGSLPHHHPMGLPWGGQVFYQGTAAWETHAQMSAEMWVEEKASASWTSLGQRETNVLILENNELHYNTFWVFPQANSFIPVPPRTYKEKEGKKKNMQKPVAVGLRSYRGLKWNSSVYLRNVKLNGIARHFGIQRRWGLMPVAFLSALWSSVVPQMAQARLFSSPHTGVETYIYSLHLRLQLPDCHPSPWLPCGLLEVKEQDFLTTWCNA